MDRDDSVQLNHLELTLSLSKPYHLNCWFITEQYNDEDSET